MSNYIDDLGASICAFEGIKYTILPELLGGGKIHSIEKKDEEVLIKSEMDQLAGIDYMLQDKNGLLGIAARAQWRKEEIPKPYPYNSFTIRYRRDSEADTEYPKRIRQIEGDYFYPYYTVQAYFEDKIKNKLLSIALTKTKEYFLFVRCNLKELSIIKKIRADNAMFLAIKWDILKKENLLCNQWDIENGWLDSKQSNKIIKEGFSLDINEPSKELQKYTEYHPPSRKKYR